MLSENIMTFAGLFLNKKGYITPIELQKFIMGREEVGKAVAIEDIEKALDTMRYAGWLNVAPDRNSLYSVYTRNMPK